LAQSPAADDDQGASNCGPVTGFKTHQNFFNANPNDFTLDVTDTHLGSNPNNFNLTERISAGYVANNSQFGRFRLQAGSPLCLNLKQAGADKFIVCWAAWD
jgi:hypothetical protein